MITLSLAQAQKKDRLAEFAALQELSGIGPISLAALDGAVKKAATKPQSPDQTPGSRALGGSTGKKTR